MSFQLHRSNRIERLVARLIEVVRTPAEGARAQDPESIVVQGRGMERWLSMRLAEPFGVWANPAFPFPRKLIRGAVAAVLGEDEERGEAFEPETLTWVVAGLLPDLLERPSFTPIAAYVKDDPRGLRRFGLASRIAETLDQYAVFRAGMIRRWERGEDPADWQAELWREIVARHGRGHIAAKIGELVRRLSAGSGPIPGFPARVSVFGISALPPLYVEALAALGRRIDVHLFVLSPSSLYWADLRTRRDIVRELVREGRELDDEALHLESGHPLLASFGRLGRDFQGVLEEAGDYQEPGPDLYEDPGSGSMLATLQGDILALRQRGERASDPLPVRLGDTDGSIAVHACHGAMREVEVLHDQLLDLFERHPDLEPRDVIVMSPAIDEYAPSIDAVFGRAADAGRPQIPYHVADRTIRATDEVVDALARLLDVLRGRMGAAEVLDLLALEAVRERFGIGAEDLDVLREWTSAAGIRWGIDAVHRCEERGTDVHENTWRFGLDRLLLGHAMRADRGVLFAGTRPCSDVEGSEELLGRFVEFCETLFSFRGALEAPRTLPRWREDIGGLLEKMIAVTRLNRDQHRRIRLSLDTLSKRAATAGFDESVALEVVRAELERDLGRSVSTGAFLSRGVAFCALVPMRSIPFRVVCLLGMSDAAFPRSRRALGFDHIADSRRPGDRSQRDDDRYLFLEAILSARDRLLITYVGHGIHENAEYPPSVVVNELLDALADSFRLDCGPLRERLVVHHPLQPFSRRYFAADGDPRLFSYDPVYHGAAQRLGDERTATPLFLRRPLPLDPTSRRIVSLDDLVRFFENPPRAFVRRRLGLVVDDEAPEVDFRDPIEPGPLERWQAAQSILDAGIRGEPLARTLAAIRAEGRLPHGSPGETLLDGLRTTADHIIAEVRAVTQGDRLDALSIDETVDGTRLSAVLRDLWPSGQLLYSYSKHSAKRSLGAWVRHLALCLREQPGVASVTRLVGRDGDEARATCFRSLPPGTAHDLLAKLLRLYWIGQTVPLPFFPISAREYLTALAKGSDETKALERARDRFGRGRSGEFAESDDLYVKLAFGGADALDPAFRPVSEGGEGVPCFGDLAADILGDLVSHEERE